MTSARETMLAQLKTDLELINGTSPYTNTVALVSRDLMTPMLFVQQGALPGIAMVDKGDSILMPASTNVRIFTLELMVLAYLVAQPGADADTACNSIAADIVYAMTNPTIWAHPASGTDTAMGSEYTGMDVIAVEAEQIAGVAVHFKFIYRNTWTAP